MNKLRVGMIGLGRIGWQFHLPQMQTHGGFELVAAVDPLAQRRDEALAKYGTTGYADVESMLAAEELDLVVIASPTPYHMDQALAAFEAGCDVFCDKPMAVSLEQVDRMIEAMKAHGRKMMIYQPHRTYVHTVVLKHILAKGLIGPLFMIKRSLSMYRRRHDWQAFSKHGGGMLRNFGVHAIDQVMYLADEGIKHISCCDLRTIASLGDADDVVKAVLETDSGILLDVDINMAAAHPFPQFHILGKYGSIIYDQADKAMKVKYCKPEELEDRSADASMAAEGRQYLSDEVITWHEESYPLSDFQQIDYYQKCYDYFAEDSPPFLPIAQSRELLRVIEACQAAAESR